MGRVAAPKYVLEAEKINQKWPRRDSNTRPHDFFASFNQHISRALQMPKVVIRQSTISH